MRQDYKPGTPSERALLRRAMDVEKDPLVAQLRATLGEMQDDEFALSPEIRKMVDASPVLTRLLAGMGDRQIASLIPLSLYRYLNPITSEVSSKMLEIFRRNSIPETDATKLVDEIRNFAARGSMANVFSRLGQYFRSAYGNAPAGERKLSDEELGEVGEALSPLFDGMIKEYFTFFRTTVREGLVSHGKAFSDAEYESFLAEETMPMLDPEKQEDLIEELEGFSVAPDHAKEIVDTIVEAAQRRYVQMQEEAGQ